MCVCILAIYVIADWANIIAYLCMMNCVVLITHINRLHSSIVDVRTLYGKVHLNKKESHVANMSILMHIHAQIIFVYSYYMICRSVSWAISLSPVLSLLSIIVLWIMEYSYQLRVIAPGSDPLKEEKVGS